MLLSKNVNNDVSKDSPILRCKYLYNQFQRKRVLNWDPGNEVDICKKNKIKRTSMSDRRVAECGDPDLSPFERIRLNYNQTLPLLPEFKTRLR